MPRKVREKWNGYGRWCVVLLLLLAASRPVSAEEALTFEAPASAVYEDRRSPLDFDGCVRLAFKQSPFFTSSSTEIDIRKIDEADSRYSVLPPVSLRTRYYFNQPNSSDNNAFNVEFASESYNPIEPYYSLKARKLITRIAVLTHMKVITEYLQRLAGAFIELGAIERAMVYQDHLVEVSKELVQYTSSRFGTGGASPLDSRMAEQEEYLAGLEKQRLVESRATIQEGIKGLLGVEEHLRVDLNAADAAVQIFGDFSPSTMSASQAQTDSIDRTIQSIKKELQALNIKLAYAKYLPRFLFRFETGDPLSGIDNGQLYFSLGVEMPLWDGLKRSHDVTRQKLTMKQIEVEGETKDIDFTGKWKSAQNKLKQARMDLDIAEKQSEIAALKERQSEIGYQSGRLPYQVVLADRKTRLDSDKGIVLKTAEKEKALLNLYYLSGALQKRYVNAGSL